MSKNLRVYGPYERSDGRKHIIIWDGVKTKTLSYAKFVLQNKIGRALKPWETADHIDNDRTNDHPDNLQVLSRGDNIRKAMKLFGEDYYRRLGLLSAEAKKKRKNAMAS